MSKTSLWLVAAVLFLIGAVAGMFNMILNGASWTLIAIPLGLMGMSLALYTRARRQ